MKKLIQLSVCGLVLGAGCQAPNLFSWRDRARGEKLTADLRSAMGNEGLPPASQKTRAETSFPNTVEQHVQLGQTEVANWYADKQPHHLPAARMHFDEALRQDPQHARAHHGLGIVCDLEKNYSEAERHYQLALAQAPNDSDILGDLGYSYLLQNRLPEGEQFLLRSVQANPSNRLAVRHLGDVYARQGKTAQAQEIYAKTLSPQEIQTALAENSPQKTLAPVPAQQEKTLWQKMVPQSKGDAFVEDLQRRHQALREEQESLAQQQRGPASPGAQYSSGQQPPAQFASNGQYAQPGDRLSQEQLLKRRLEAIDHEQYRAVSNGPILIDDRSGEITRLPGSELSSNWTQAPQQTGPAPMPSGFVGGATQPGPQNPSPQRWSGVEPAQGYGGNQRVNPAYLQQQGTGSGVTTAAANVPAPAGSSQGYPVTNAYGAVRQSSVPPDFASAATASQMQQTAPPQGLPAAVVQGQLPQQGPPGSGGQTDAYQQARQTAAMMGMGMGPGTMFPVFPAAPGIDTPGSSSYVNGSAFPAPQRFLPTDIPPRDLQQAFRPEPIPQSAPDSSVGILAPTTAPSFTQQQFGTASRFDDNTLRQAGVPPSFNQDPAVQGYEMQRQQMSREVSQSMSQVWGQGPMNMTVTQVGATTYPPPDQQGMYTPQTSNDAVSPPPWPYLPAKGTPAAAYNPPQPSDYQQPPAYQQSGANQAPAQSPSQYPAATQATSNWQQGNVVTPPPYHPVDRGQNGSAQGSNAAAAYGRELPGLPLIRPAPQ